MNKSHAFISIITTDDYLPGILVLSDSLMATNPHYPFLALLTPNISSNSLSILNKHKISYKILPNELGNPTDVDKKHRWFPTYSKLYVFDQIEYDKVVYLDADMLILRNIDDLFERPHMSATNAGGMLPRKSSWTHLNSGLFVLEPSHELFEDMMSKVGRIENLQSGGTSEKPRFGSDQDFLNAYYPDWPNKKELHLDHKYNIFHYYLDEYNSLFGYTIEDGPRPISILHYASYLKPWHSDGQVNMNNQNSVGKLEAEAIKLWRERYQRLLNL